MPNSGDVIQTTPASNANGQVVRVAGTVSTTSGTGGAATGTTTRVAANVANVTLLAANANRKGASITNNSPAGATLYVKRGATASIAAGAESYSVPLVNGAYYEVPFGYTGIIDGIWSGADANGEALITEDT